MLRNLTLRDRLAMTCGGLLLLMLIVAAVAFVALRHASQETSVLARQELALAGAASAMQAAQLEQMKQRRVAKIPAGIHRLAGLDAHRR